MLKAVNDYEQSAERFMQYGAKVLRPQDLENYKLTEDQVTRILHAPSLADEMIAEMSLGDEVLGQTLPWSKTYSLFRIRKAEMTVWSGYNGHGKSLLLGFVLNHLASQGETGLLVSLEMRWKQSLRRMIRQHTGIADPAPSLIRAYFDAAGKNVWLYDHVGAAASDHILALCRYASEELLCQHIIIDSLMKCGMGADDYNAQKRFCDLMSSYAKDSGLHIHLVAHSRKKDNEHLQGKMDVKGTSEITDMADNVMVVWLNKAKMLAKQDNDHSHDREADTILIIDKQRNGEWTGHVNLWFDPKSQRFLESSGEQ